MITAILGLGNIGLPVAKYIQKQNLQVKGYDINRVKTEQATKQGVQSSIEFPAADIYVVAVNTWFRNGAPDISAVDNCLSRIAAANPKALILIESTMAVGATRQISQRYGLSNVAVCPHRWWDQDEQNHGVKQLRVLGALNEIAYNVAWNFYNRISIPTLRVSSVELAEATKIAENAHRYMEIAYVEQLKLIADKTGLDFQEWRQAINTKWNVHLLEARDGIGKECLPKDTEFLAALHPNPAMLRGAIETNRQYVESLAVKQCVKTQ